MLYMHVAVEQVSAYWQLFFFKVF